MIVTNNKEANRFEYAENNEMAYLEYRFYKTKDIALMHTVVPENLKGKGVATTLAKAAFEYADSINKMVMVYCPFVARFVKNNPEYKKQLDTAFHQ